MESNLKSVLWKYYEITDENKAKCKNCHKELSRTGGSSTTTLKRHLQSIHSELYKEYVEELKNDEQKNDSEINVQKRPRVQTKNHGQQSTLDHCFLKVVSAF